jgi:hypothetical protein
MRKGKGKGKGKGKVLKGGTLGGDMGYSAGRNISNLKKPPEDIER